MKVSDYIEGCWEKSYISLHRREEIVSESLSYRANNPSTTATNPNVQQIANSKWADIPKHIYAH